MIITEKFKVKKHELKVILNQLNPAGLEKELACYDFIIEVCDNYNRRVNITYEEVRRPLIDAIKAHKSYDELLSIEKSVADETLYWRMAHRHDPAFIIVRNFYEDSAYNYDKHFSKSRKIDGLAGKYYLDPDAMLIMEKIAYEDGAVVLDSKEENVAANTHFIHLDSQSMIAANYQDRLDLGLDPLKTSFFGFEQDVNIRHLSAMYVSYIPKLVVYTLGERIEQFDMLNGERTMVGIDDGQIRRFEEGFLTASTLDSERGIVLNNVKTLMDRRSKN